MTRRRKYPNGVRAAWWNLGDGPWLPKARFLSRVVRRYGFEVIFLSEAGDRLRDLKEWAEENGFVLVVGDGPGGDSTPALVLDDPDFRGHHWETITDRQHIGAAGAGPSTAKAKGILRIRFGWLRLFGIHALPSVQQGNLPNTPLRRSLWKRLTGALGEKLARRTRPGAAGGDFNLIHPHPLFGSSYARFVQWVKGGTHDKRKIDLIFSWFCQAVDVINIDAPSDHNLVGATFLRRKLWRKRR